MSDNNAVARATVSLPRALSGTELMAAIEAVIQRKPGMSYVQEKHFIGSDAYLVGQASPYPYEHLIIAAEGSEEDFIFPNEMYQHLVVKSYRWPRPTYAVGYDEAGVIEIVRAFADELLQEVSQY